MLWTQTHIKSIHDGYSLKIQITISISRGLVFCAFFLWPLFCLSFFSTYGFCMFKLFLHILCVKFRIRASFIATMVGMCKKTITWSYHFTSFNFCFCFMKFGYDHRSRIIYYKEQISKYIMMHNWLRDNNGTTRRQNAQLSVSKKIDEALYNHQYILCCKWSVMKFKIRKHPA